MNTRNEQRTSEGPVMSNPAQGQHYTQLIIIIINTHPRERSAATPHIQVQIRDGGENDVQKHEKQPLFQI